MNRRKTRYLPPDHGGYTARPRTPDWSEKFQETRTYSAIVITGTVILLALVLAVLLIALWSVGDYLGVWRRMS